MDSPSDDVQGTDQIASKYVSVKLTTDLSILSASEKKMLPHLFAAADIMNDLFWIQAYGNKEALMATISNPELRRFTEINYGPWDRLNNNAPFLDQHRIKTARC